MEHPGTEPVPGLLEGSFIPPQPIRWLESLLRERTHAQRDKNRVVNRLAGLLERANRKPGTVASNVVGVSGRRMLCALLEDEENPARLASLALGSRKDKQTDLVRGMRRRYGAHLPFELGLLLASTGWNGRFAPSWPITRK